MDESYFHLANCVANSFKEMAGTLSGQSRGFVIRPSHCSMRKCHPANA
jgi:hypothetical protein